MPEYVQVFNLPWSLGSRAPLEPPRLNAGQYFEPTKSVNSKRPTCSATEDEPHDRKDSLQLSPLDHPNNRYDDDGNSDQDGDYSEFFGPETLLEFEPDWLPPITSFEVREPVDPFMYWANVVGMMNGVHERVGIGIVFGGFGDWDAVGGVLGEEEYQPMPN